MSHGFKEDVRIHKEYCRRMNAVTRAANRRIEAGNRRRTRCCESILEWAMKKDVVRMRVWITKLVSAGFGAQEGAWLEQQPCEVVESVMRSLLGIEEAKHG